MSKIRYMENMLNQNMMITEEQKEKHYNVKQASERVGVAYSTINKACHSGQIRCSTVPSPTGRGDTFLIAESDLREWNATRKVRSPKGSTNSVQDLTVEELAQEILRRIQLAYEEGYKQGRKEAKSEFMVAFKGIK